MEDVTAGLMQWSGLKVQRISCIEMTQLESKGEGNASTFSSVLPTSSLLARFRRVSSRVIFTADHAFMPAVTVSRTFLQVQSYYDAASSD
jgi:hypothetical protein